MNLLNKYPLYWINSRNTVSKLVVFIRLVAILFVPIYVLSLYKFFFGRNPTPTLTDFVEAFFHYLFYGIIFNFGLYFITTKGAEKYKITATLLYLPTILATPFIIGGRLDWFGSIFYIWPALVYWRFCPWRKNA